MMTEPGTYHSCMPECRDCKIRRLETALHDAEAIGDFPAELRDRLLLKESAEAMQILVRENSTIVATMRKALEPLAEQDCASWGCDHAVGEGPCEPKNARDAIASIFAPKKGPKSEYRPSRHEHEHGAPLVADCDGWCRSKFERYLRNLRAEVEREREAADTVRLSNRELIGLLDNKGATIATLQSGYETAAKRLHNTESHETLAGVPFEFCEISICKLNREALATSVPKPTENDPLRPFVLAILEHFGPEQGMELDCCDFQDLATQFGIIKWEKYDPERHGEGHDMDPGDDIWLPAVSATQGEG